MIQSGDDTEEVNQNQLNGNQDYENGDMEMEVGFEGKYIMNILFCSTVSLIPFAFVVE